MKEVIEDTEWKHMTIYTLCYQQLKKITKSSLYCLALPYTHGKEEEFCVERGKTQVQDTAVHYFSRLP